MSLYLSKRETKMSPWWSDSISMLKRNLIWICDYYWFLSLCGYLCVRCTFVAQNHWVTPVPKLRSWIRASGGRWGGQGVTWRLRAHLHTCVLASSNTCSTLFTQTPATDEPKHTSPLLSGYKWAAMMPAAAVMELLAQHHQQHFRAEGEKKEVQRGQKPSNSFSTSKKILAWPTCLHLWLYWGQH